MVVSLPPIGEGGASARLLLASVPLSVGDDIRGGTHSVVAVMRTRVAEVGVDRRELLLLLLLGLRLVVAELGDAVWHVVLVVVDEELFELRLTQQLGDLPAHAILRPLAYVGVDVVVLTVIAVFAEAPQEVREVVPDELAEQPVGAGQRVDYASRASGPFGVLSVLPAQRDVLGEQLLVGSLQRKRG